MSLILDFSRIDPDLSKPVKIHPLPHMYVVKDLVPVSCCCCQFIQYMVMLVYKYLIWETLWLKQLMHKNDCIHCLTHQRRILDVLPNHTIAWLVNGQ